MHKPLLFIGFTNNFCRLFHIKSPQNAIYITGYNAKIMGRGGAFASHCAASKYHIPGLPGGESFVPQQNHLKTVNRQPSVS